MPRIAYLEPDQVKPEDQDIMAGNYSAFKAMAHSPATCRQFRAMVYHLKTTALDPRLRELALIQVGWLSQCRYEWFHHVKTGLESGVSEEDIRIIIDGSPQAYARLDEPARLVLEATCQMYIGPASAQIVTALERVLGAQALVDLIVAMGFYVGGVRILGSFDLDLEPQYEQYTKRFPLRASGLAKESTQ